VQTDQLFAAMPTPQRTRIESMELEKWKKQQSFDKKMHAMEAQLKLEREQVAFCFL